MEDIYWAILSCNSFFSFLQCCLQDEEVDYQLVDFYEETKVKFADLSEDMLWEYINSGEPM